ncbi:MAG: hypothetical protein JST83_14085 [Bacteroidetes bacterium]|nr:hypothetical protein [Bacteroidota bacterium]
MTSLKGGEFKLLRKWMNRYAKDNDEQKLFDCIGEYYPAFDSAHLSKEKIYKKTFGAVAYSDSRMRNTTFQLCRQIELFIIHHRTQHDAFYSGYQLLVHYEERNENKLFESQLKELKKELEKTITRGGDYYYRQFLLDSAFNKYLKSKQKRNIEPNIQNVSDNLDVYYIIHKLSVYCEALNYQNIIKTEYEIGFIDQLLAQIKEDKILDVPSVKLYYTALLTLTHSEDERNFYDLKNHLETYRDILQEEDVNDISTLARNFCIKRINKGDTKFTRDLFELYQFELKYLDGESSVELSPLTYKNIITLALNLNETGWAHEFIESHTRYLPESHREPSYSYNMARYYFIRKKYDEVIRLLSTVEYSDLFMMLGAKVLLIKTYYELGESSALDSLIHSFRQLLKNKTLLGYHRQNYVSFIKLLEKLTKVIRTDKQSLQKLKAEISNTKALVEREWLMAKL